ncbi:hypothetical protein TNCV_1339021 [Trichonephila clavipes]|nr:hypothetical protein TNCV_1339021 [Trichonephila clavipes]
MPDQVGQSEARPPVFKSPSKLGTHLSTHCTNSPLSDFTSHLTITSAHSHRSENRLRSTANFQYIYLIPNLHNPGLLLELDGKNCHLGPEETPRGH